MRYPHRQRGIGWFGLLFVLGVIALGAIVTIKCLPLVINEFEIRKAVETVAHDPELANADAVMLRGRLQRFWDVEDITQITPRDIRVVRENDQRTLAYDYEARAHLFYNVSILLAFSREVPVGRGGGD